MAEVPHGVHKADANDGRSSSRSGTSSDQIIDPWCEPCLRATKKKIDAVGLCSECNTFICGLFLEVHKAWPMLQNHRILRGEKMPKSFAEKPVKYADCGTHFGKAKNQFCTNHYKMICNECSKQTHQRCRIKPISDICKFLSSDDIERFKAEVKNVKVFANTTKAEIEKNIAHLETQKRLWIQSTKQERDKIIDKANEIFDESVSDINAVCERKKSQMAEQIASVTYESQTLDDIIDNIEKTVFTYFDQNMFIQMQETVKKTQECHREIRNISKQLQKIEFSLSIAREISTFLDYNKTLGDIKEELTPISTGEVTRNILFPASLSVMGMTTAISKSIDLSQITVKKLSSLNAKLISDNSNCCIKGLDITDNGTLLISDENNKSLKVFSHDNKLLSSVPLSHWCYDIAVISATKAVASTCDSKLHFLDITDPAAISIQKSISMRFCVIFIAACSDRLAVTTWNSPKSVKMITMDGVELWSVSNSSSGQSLFRYPEAILVTKMNGNETVIVSDSGNDSVRFLDANNGTLLRTINMKGRNPHGLTADDNGNIFVCCESTQEICIWSNAISESRILLAGQDIRPKPNHVIYDPSKRKLFVSYFMTNDIDIFEFLVSRR